MAEYFNVGDVKIRPGGYFNIDKNGDDNAFGAVDGITAVTVKASFGPIGKVVVIGRNDGYEQIYGTAGTTDAIREAFLGGAKTAIVYRVGTGGKEASAELTVGTGKVTITSKHPGDMPLAVTVRNKLTDPMRKECIIYTGNDVYEKVNFEVGENEAVALKAGFASSKNFTVAVPEGVTGVVTNVEQVKFSGGTNPTTTTADYSAAFAEFEKYFFNSICVDTEDAAVHLLLKEFMQRIFQDGIFGMGFVAEKSTRDLEERMAAAEGFDAENITYVLNAKCYADGLLLEGYQVAAYIAGLYAANPSNKSLTHTVLKRYTELGERLTNSQMVKAEQRGCLVLSLSSKDEVWIDSAINTLINPPENMDEGWKKLRRVKTRHELLYRANAQADDLVGRVDNDVNGRAVIIGKIQKIINDMIDEGKLTSGVIKESTRFTSDKDYCYFDIEIIDKDSAEKIYLFYRFQFSTIAEA